MPLEMKTWPYGTTRRGTVLSRAYGGAPANSMAEINAAAARHGVTVVYVHDDQGEGHFLVGEACGEKTITGDVGTLTFTKGGPAGGYWKFSRDPKQPTKENS